MGKVNLTTIESLAAQARERATQRESGARRDFKWFNFKPAPAQNQIRILEPTYEDGRVALLVYKHTIGNDKYDCIEKTWPNLRQECPICKSLRVLYDQGKDTTGKWARGRAYTNCIDRNAQNEGVKILGVPMSVYDYIIQMMVARDANDHSRYIFGDITDTQTGRDILISYDSNSHQYNTTMFPISSPLHTDPAICQQWLSERWNMDSIFKFPNEQEFQKIRAAADYILASASTFTPPSTPTHSATNKQLPKTPACYALDWKPKPDTPTKCYVCPVELSCLEDVKKKLSTGWTQPEVQTPYSIV